MANIVNQENGIISHTEPEIDENGIDWTPGDLCDFCGWYHIWPTENFEDQKCPNVENVY